MAQLVGRHPAKGKVTDSWSGHMPGLQFGPQPECVGEASD